MRCGLVHVERVPKHDCRDNHVKSHCTFLLRGVRSIIDPTLGMGEHGLGQCVPRLTLVETGLTVPAQLWIFQPIEHEQRTLDPPDFPKR